MAPSPLPTDRASATGSPAALADGPEGIDVNAPAGPPISIAPTRSLTDAVTGGFAWMGAQALASKLLTAAGQILLARLLSKDDWGVVGLAFTINAFALVVQQTGLSQILVRRQKHLRRWENPAFWMSVGSGVAGAVMLLAVLPFVARIFPYLTGREAAQLRGSLCVLALTAFIAPLGNVSTAKLQAQLRFRALAMGYFWPIVLQVILSVAMARRGMGPYSFIVPVLLMTACRNGYLLYAAGVVVHWSLQLRRWRHLIGESGLMFIYMICYTVITNGDNTVLGLTHSAEVVGLFYFAFNLSMQAMGLIGAQFGSVILPALSSLKDEPVRQVLAHLRASRSLAIILVPACCLQAALAGPGFHILFARKWDAAIPMLQVLSVGMAFRSAGWLATSLLVAQSRFRFLAGFFCIYALVFMVAVSVAVEMGAGMAVSVTESICCSVFDVSLLYAAVRPAGGTWSDVLKVLAIPVAACAVATPAAMLVPRFIPGGLPAIYWVQLIVGALVFAGIYILLVWRTPDAQEFLHRLGKLFRRQPASC